MKRFFILSIITCSLLLTSCIGSDVGVIGGADDPTSIYVKGQFGEQYEKKPIRMFKAKGELYYDSGLVSDATSRCGTLDGNLTKGASKAKSLRMTEKLILRLKVIKVQQALLKKFLLMANG